jgi:hypothetical protein
MNLNGLGPPWQVEFRGGNSIRLIWLCVPVPNFHGCRLSQVAGVALELYGPIMRDAS